MSTRPVVPDTAVAATRRYCKDKVPTHFLNELRVECDVHFAMGDVVTPAEPVLHRLTVDPAELQDRLAGAFDDSET